LFNRNLKFATAFSLLAVAFTAVCLGGCQKSDKNLVAVKGKVTYKGQPLVCGVITFRPIQNDVPTTGRSSTGVIGTDGIYQLSTYQLADGVPPGEYLVAVDGGLTKPEGTVTLESPSPPKTETDRQLDKFRNTSKSGLKATVPADKNSVEIDFHLEG
jgi:hypothetical protein